MQRFFSKTAKLLLMGIPLVLSMWGMVVVDGGPFLHSLFLSVCMYLFNYQDVPTNIFVELARWIAPVATASGILLAFVTLREKMVNAIRYRRGKSIAVYGPEAEKKALLSVLGRNGIDGKTALVRAHSYILLADEEENFQFYYQNKIKLKDRTVYLKCTSLKAQSVSDPGLRLFCPEETAARLFWKKHCLYETSQKAGHRMNLVFLGFGKLGEELLLWGLQNNIFSPDQKITYHIFGDGAQFQSIYSQLSAISDPICFYEDSWYTHKELLDQADMILVLTQEGQMELLKNLLFVSTDTVFHVFAADCSGAELLAGHERLRLYDWKLEAQKPENILSGLLFERAKRINLRYAHLYSQVPETEESKETEWRKLDAFTRYSNVSAADYHEVRLAMLRCMGQPDQAELISTECLELLSELEHERWCRYHYLNNWKYGIPENGRNKDMVKRIHNDLLAYSSLTDSEKEKDRENIRVLLGIK